MPTELTIAKARIKALEQALAPFARAYRIAGEAAVLDPSGWHAPVLIHTPTIHALTTI
jgi:hypothetical protein